MDSRAKSKSERSLCEKSMHVVANVIRLSSFSIAQKTFGTTTAGKTGKDHSGSDYSDTGPEKEPLFHHHHQHDHQFLGSRRSQEPLGRANRKYVIKPVVESNGSTSQVIREEERSFGDEVKPKKEECVDGMATDYIKKIRNKLVCGL